MICILSDTHENLKVLKPAIEQIKKHSPDLVIHCGDIISPPLLDHFKGLPMRFVFGNNDGERAGLKKKCLELGFGEIDDMIELVYKGKKLLVYHGTNPRVLEAHIAAQQHDFVFHGHTHVPRDEMQGRTRIINPGALFMAESYTFAVLDVESGSLTFEAV
jgi:putative phosphoesterase